MANIQRFWNKLLPPCDSLILLPPAPRSSQFTDEVTTSKYLSLCSSPWSGVAHQIASSLGRGESVWGGSSTIFGSSTGLANT